jgi:hypothetical protein
MLVSSPIIRPRIATALFRPGRPGVLATSATILLAEVLADGVVHLADRQRRRPLGGPDLAQLTRRLRDGVKMHLAVGGHEELDQRAFCDAEPIAEFVRKGHGPIRPDRHAIGRHERLRS